jgi:hypothetical protein
MSWSRTFVNRSVVAVVIWLCLLSTCRFGLVLASFRCVITCAGRTEAVDKTIQMRMNIGLQKREDLCPRIQQTLVEILKTYVLKARENCKFSCFEFVTSFCPRPWQLRNASAPSYPELLGLSGVNVMPPRCGALGMALFMET